MQLPTQSEPHKQSASHFFGRALAMAVVAELVLSGIYTSLIMAVNILVSTSHREIYLVEFLGPILFINIVTLPLGIVTALAIAARLYMTPVSLDRPTASWLGVETAMLAFLAIVLFSAWNNLLLLCTAVCLLVLWLSGRIRVRTMFGIILLFQLGSMVIGEVMVGSGGAWIFYVIVLLIPGGIYLGCAAWATPRLNHHLWLVDEVGSERPEHQPI